MSSLSASRVTKFVQKTLLNILGVAAGAFNLVIVPIFAVYLLYDMNHIRSEGAELVPLRYRSYVYSRFAQVDRLLSAFVRGQVTVCLILGTFYAIGLTACGVPMGLLVGMVIGFFNMIPFMSTVIGLPTIVRSPPKRRCQSPWLISITGLPARSSSSVKCRPTRGATPSRGKRLADTAAPATRSASPPPESVCVVHVQMPSCEKLRLSSRQVR
jgi:hypothetical protein